MLRLCRLDSDHETRVSHWILIVKMKELELAFFKKVPVVLTIDVIKKTKDKETKFLKEKSFIKIILKAMDQLDHVTKFL